MDLLLVLILFVGFIIFCFLGSVPVKTPRIDGESEIILCWGPGWDGRGAGFGLRVCLLGCFLLPRVEKCRKVNKYLLRPENVEIKLKKRQVKKWNM